MRIDTHLGQLHLRRTSLFRIKISIYRGPTFLNQVLVYSIKFFRAGTFSTTLILLKTYRLRTAILSEKELFGNRYFFREGIFSNLHFEKRYFYTTVVLIYKLIRFTLKSNYRDSVGVLSRVIINAQFLPCRYLFNNLFN